MTAVAELDAPEVRAIASPSEATGTAFSSLACFEGAQRMAKMLASSDLVPKQYANNIPNCVIALEIAQRLGMNPLMVMQNLYMVHNRPAWSSQFLIACVNGCKRFSPLRYEFTKEEAPETISYSFTVYNRGEKERKEGKEVIKNITCTAWAYDKTGEKLIGPAASIRMAVQEGWFSKDGSKWKTMPELMLRYRAATFFARTYAPELTMGMQTQEELHDVDAKETEVAVVGTKTAAVHEKLIKRREERVASAEAEVIPETKPEEKVEVKPEVKDQTSTPAAAPAPLPRNAAAGKASADVSEARRVAWINDALVFADSDTAQALRELMDGRTPQQIASDNEGYAVFRAKAKGMIDAAKK